MESGIDIPAASAPIQVVVGIDLSGGAVRRWILSRVMRALRVRITVRPNLRYVTEDESVWRRMPSVTMPAD